MANVCIAGRKGSNAVKEIIKGSGIKRFAGQKTDAVINYGLAGRGLQVLFNRYPILKRTPIINKYIGLSKYKAVKEASRAGIIVPKTRLSLPRITRLSSWIEKRVHSSQGNGIIKARGRGRISGKYYQRMVNDRLYELRVHAFLWTPKKRWVVLKRLGPHDQIAWNFHKGGHFQATYNSVGHKVFDEARDISKRVLELRSMAFGGVDFIVNNDSTIYFIEVNSSPGLTALSSSTYVDAMSDLKDMAIAKLKRYTK